MVKRYKGINIETDLTIYNKVVEKIHAFNFSQNSNSDLKLINRRLKEQVRQGEDLDYLLPEAYALVSEVCSRELGMTPFPVQIIAGIAMYHAKLVQMKTGEGKTLAAVFPVYLNALTGKEVHVMTANDYLAKRDALWMGKVYKFLELNVEYIQEKTSDNQRQKAYQADITYLTAKQGGFDFLRDQLQYDREKLLQRNYYMTIVDEADFIMIDEALEAKEGLILQSTGRVSGSITIRNYINLYPKIAAMTATAVSAANELMHFYNLSTVIIPPNKVDQMEYLPDKVFVNIKVKVKAVVEDIRKVHASGRPVLVGTRTVKESEDLAEQLKMSGINCQILNAKNDEQEAAIISCAGMLGAVTISTNMAGRGTDIKLGAEEDLNKEQILALGGLYVIGTNHYESVRIDNQLRGRAGRQGDPGSSSILTFGKYISTMYI